MARTRESGQNRAIALALVFLVLGPEFVLGGCAQTVTMETVKSPVLERRVPVDPSEPPVHSEWRVEGGRIVGHVAWNACNDQRSWSLDERRVDHVRPMPVAAWLTAGAGVALTTVGFAIHDFQLTKTCRGLYSDDCTVQEPENATSNLLIAAGVIGVVTGVLALAVKPSDKITVLKHEPHAETSVSACVAPEDLAIMSLVLKLGPNRFVHVTVQTDGAASADLAPDARLPKGADLPVLVYRAPPALAKALPRWQVVGQVHVPD